MANQLDILIFLSDQHDGRVMHCAGHPLVRTPNMDKLAEDGTMFTDTYTPCPLCVPARNSMLSGRLPCRTGVFTNHGAMHPEMPTFLHAMALAGYETVLCGRMHFEGDDQRHGFMKRVAGDITPTAIGPAVRSQPRLGPLSAQLTEPGSIHVVGGGNSPSQDFDRYVCDAAEEYLAQPHEKPQCLVVGTYGPHFPYVAPKELYDYYYERVTMPLNVDLPVDFAYKSHMRDTDPELIRAVQAAYLGMVEFEDSCVGRVRAAWDKWLKENGREGVFAYTSDHGDHEGDHGFYGKQSLYEAASRIPLLFAGAGVPAGQKLTSPASLLDIGPTCIALGGARELPLFDGESLLNRIQTGTETPDRAVITEWITEPYGKPNYYGRMVRRGDWKFMSYPKFPDDDHLYRPDEDPWELHDLKEQYPEIAAELRAIAFDGIDPDAVLALRNQREADYAMLADFNRKMGKLDTELWPGSGDRCPLPDSFISTTQPLPERLKKNW